MVAKEKAKMEWGTNEESCCDLDNSGCFKSQKVSFELVLILVKSSLTSSKLEQMT